MKQKINELRIKQDALLKELDLISQEIKNYESKHNRDKLSLYHTKNESETYFSLDECFNVIEVKKNNGSLDYIKYENMNYFTNKLEAKCFSKYIKLSIKVFKALNYVNNYKNFDKSYFKYLIAIYIKDRKNKDQKYIVDEAWSLDYSPLVFIDDQASKNFRELIEDKEIIDFLKGIEIIKTLEINK